LNHKVNEPTKRKDMSFRRFAAIYSIVIGWFIVASLLEFDGVYFYVILILSSIILWTEVCPFLARRIESRFHFTKADDEEIRKEDDVLLQGATFISAILFFYVNTLLSDRYSKIILGLAFSLLTGSFYIFRAYAKIKSRADYRFFSAFLFAAGATSYAFEIALLLFPTFFPTILALPAIFLSSLIMGLAFILYLSNSLLLIYFYKRYGSPRLLNHHKDRNL